MKCVDEAKVLLATTPKPSDKSDLRARNTFETELLKHELLLLGWSGIDIVPPVEAPQAIATVSTNADKPPQAQGHAIAPTNADEASKAIAPTNADEAPKSICTVDDNALLSTLVKQKAPTHAGAGCAAAAATAPTNAGEASKAIAPTNAGEASKAAAPTNAGEASKAAAPTNAGEASKAIAPTTSGAVVMDTTAANIAAFFGGAAAAVPLAAAAVPLAAPALPHATGQWLSPDRKCSKVLSARQVKEHTDKFKDVLSQLNLPSFSVAQKGIDDFLTFELLFSLSESSLSDDVAVTHDSLAQIKYQWNKHMKWQTILARDTKAAATSVKTHIELVSKAKIRDDAKAALAAEKNALRDERVALQARSRALTASKPNQAAQLPAICDVIDTVDAKTKFVEVTDEALSKDHFQLPFVVVSGKALEEYMVNDTVQSMLGKWPQEYKKDDGFVEHKVVNAAMTKKSCNVETEQLFAGLSAPVSG